VTSHFLRQRTLRNSHFLHLRSWSHHAASSSGYSITKLSDLQLASYTAAESENITAIAFHPGIVDTNMATDFWKPCAKDTTELAGAVAVWLSTPAARFLNSRYITTNYDVEELVKRQEEVVQKALLRVEPAEDFAKAQYIDG
jgi:NAD(P)-dependent dehydrogenase (short-subunit alcohol dehydrogenase family)